MYKIILVAGASGSGKSTLIDGALSRISKLEYLKSYTTRKPRDTLEQASHEYDFVDEKTYKILRKQSPKWDHSEIYGNYYGVDVESVKKKLQKQHLILATPLDIDLITSFNKIYEVSILVIYVAGRKIERSKERTLTDNHTNVKEIRDIADMIFIPTGNIRIDKEKFANALLQFASELQRIFFINISSGVCQESDFRGVVFIILTTSFSCLAVMVPRSVFFEKTLRSLPLVFSFLPLCQGAWASAK